MGGIIEDKIFEVLMDESLTAFQITRRLEKIHYKREYRTINRHLRKMFSTRQLERRKMPNNEYVYWNSCMAKG